MEATSNDRKSPSAAVMDVERDRPAMITEPWVMNGPGGGPHLSSIVDVSPFESLNRLVGGKLGRF